MSDSKNDLKQMENLDVVAPTHGRKGKTTPPSRHELRWLKHNVPGVDEILRVKEKALAERDDHMVGACQDRLTEILETVLRMGPVCACPQCQRKNQYGLEREAMHDCKACQRAREFRKLAGEALAILEDHGHTVEDTGIETVQDANEQD